MNSGQCGPPEEVEGTAGDVSAKLVSQVEGRCSLVGTVQDHVEDEPEFRSQESSTDASRYVCMFATYVFCHRSLCFFFFLLFL